MYRKQSGLKALLAGLALSGCVPDLDTDESTLRAPRVIAVIAEPAEARPDQEVRYSALLVDQNGVVNDAPMAWFYCTAQKPLAELGPVNRACLSPASGKLTRIGNGAAPTGRLPATACALFGPNLPPPMEGQEPGRPVDPDQTGGYKQPVMLGVNTSGSDELVLYEQRLLCDLPGVTPQLLLDYKLRYHANQNPRIDAVQVTRASGEHLMRAAGEPLELSAGEQVTLSALWASCPDSDSCGDGICGPDESRLTCLADCGANQPPGCTGQERYVWFDTQRRVLSVRREAMRVAWYAGAGEYEEERTGVDEEQPSTSTTNKWTAPGNPGATSLWLVARDARGGTGAFELPITIR